MSSTATDTFEAHRSKLIGLAYRITGSRAEAEDIAQETFLKWFAADHETIRSPYAWLAMVATRISLDRLKSARVQRQSYIGPWLPEPFVADSGSPEHELEFVSDDKTPDQALELDESISMALLVVLEQLSPAERAVFILHDLFHFDFDEIGEMLEQTGIACRKLASRARAKVGRNAVLGKQSKDEHLRILAAFFGAVKNGDMAGLAALLKENVTFHADGGGKAIASLEVLQGSGTVAAFLIHKVRPDFISVAARAMTITRTWFNGSPGLVVWRETRAVTAFNFELQDGAISRIHALRNPDKLRLFGKRSVQAGKRASEVENNST